MYICNKKYLLNHYYNNYNFHKIYNKLKLDKNKIRICTYNKFME